MTDHQLTGMEIAVIGMDGRFPGAMNLEEFWFNLKNGIESLAFFSGTELKEAGLDPDLTANPGYVKSCGGILDKKDYFDAAFFGYTPVEAGILDPQTRLFLETSWRACEDAGIEPGTYQGLIGLYAGSSWNFHWESLVHLPGQENPLGEFNSWLLTNRDNLCTIVSYKLGLKGPSVFLKSTCSTSLSAVHLACQAILNGECDIALAGGVSVTQWKKSGYLYREGMILSPDGHCRAFDTEAKGTVSGEGVGVVVLKQLTDALRDNDHIYAVIKGSAINNDGSRKIGYTAPSIQGQADVIREALAVANVEPESISYIETHGTGTPVGDPIEIEALKTAFNTDKKKYCGIGSIKTNIGHLDAAAGIAGLIKTILALTHHLIPPGLHFNSPNPRIDFENSPFYVNTRPCPWQPGDSPPRAGVSSFGIGGTNVHVILEAAPAVTQLSPMESKDRSDRLILLSAATETALHQLTQNLIQHFKKNPGINLADATYTLQTGRKAFTYRKMAVCASIEEAIDVLSHPESRNVRTGKSTEQKKSVVFMFPGLGGQYVNMGQELYESEPLFRTEMNRCFEILKSITDYNIKEILYPSLIADKSEKPGQIDIRHPEIAQLAIFIFEYALAQFLLQLGIQPDAMIGYSFGEYPVACLAGVLSLPDALSLVVKRGQLLRELPRGGMISVPVPRDKLLPFLHGTNLSLAVDNGPSCIVSGSPAEIQSFENRMKQNRYVCVPLTHASRALHSHLMKPILPAFAGILGNVSLKAPEIPYISNLTGQWITPRQVTRPDYWTAHLSETVCFADGIKELLKLPDPVFLEIGPGYDLSVLLRHQVDRSSESLILHFNDGPHGKIAEQRFLLTKIGQLWLSGFPIDWSSYYASETRQRIALPLYPFQGQPYWPANGILPRQIVPVTAESPAGKNPDIADWFYVPTWKRSVWRDVHHHVLREKKCWLLFMDETGLAELLARQLEQEGQEVIRTRPGTRFEKIKQGEYLIDPRQSHDYNTLFAQLGQADSPPTRIVHCWNITSEEKETAERLDLGFYSLFYLARAAGKQSFKEHLHIMAISNHVQRVTSEETLCPAKAALLGAVKVIPREYANISCRSIDIVLPGSENQKNRFIDRLLTEFSPCTPGNTSTNDSDNGYETVVAYRGDYRWVQIFEPLHLEPEIPIEKSNEEIHQLKTRGVYLITGGLGGIGLVLAEHLACRVQANLVLVGRTDFPAREQWEQWLAEHPPEEPLCRKIKKLQDLENAGAHVLVRHADVCELQQMLHVVNLALEQFGHINGVIHAAGLPDGGMIPMRSRQDIEPILAPKVKGTLVLNQVLKENNIRPDFVFLCSSISSVLGMFGQLAYCAANAFLDAFAYYNTHENGIFTVSVNWDFWQEVGMGVETINRLKENADITDAHLLLENGILPAEGIRVFNRVLDCRQPQVIISTQELGARLKRRDYQWDYQAAAGAAASLDPAGNPEARKKSYPRPALITEYKPPASEFEKTAAHIFQTYFGFEQVGIDDNLFEYGITSLDMIHINHTLQSKISIDIPIVAMFEYPTIHSLGQYLEPQQTEENQKNQEKTSQVENLEEVEDSLHRSIDIFDHME